MNISGKATLFRNETKEGGIYFTLSLSEKQEDGKYLHAKMYVNFKKELTKKLEARTKIGLAYPIEVTKGWLKIAKPAKAEKTFVMAFVSEATFGEPKESKNSDLPF